MIVSNGAKALNLTYTEIFEDGLMNYWEYAPLTPEEYGAYEIEQWLDKNDPTAKLNLSGLRY